AFRAGWPTRRSGGSPEPVRRPRDDDGMAREIDARGIPWWRALLGFPLLLGPRILLKGAGTALWRAAQRALEKRRERPSERRPPEPTGLGLFVLGFLFLGGVLSIALAAQGVGDRVAATGLMLVTLSTL